MHNHYDAFRQWLHTTLRNPQQKLYTGSQETAYIFLLTAHLRSITISVALNKKSAQKQKAKEEKGLLAGPFFI
jgi:hypothetical protein